MQVPFAVAAGVAAHQPGAHHLAQLGLKVVAGVTAAHRPQFPVDLSGLVGEPPAVVGDGGHALECAFGGETDFCERLRLVRLGLVGADAGH
jgi:hypothetical protein